jgi:large subunit ribosomal protein L9
MEIILREDIDKLGQRGQVVKVAAGYARNYLLPRKLAVTANESNKKIVEQERQAHLKKDAKHVADAQELAKLMAAASVTISQKAGENDQLFGSVTANESNKKIVEQERQAHLKKDAKHVADAQELAKLMAAASVTIAQKAGENDQLFGSVTANDIAVALEKLGYTIDRKKVQLDEPIKTLGEFKVSVRLHRDVSVDVPVHVVKEA